jgi:mannose-6-phosphate isomerase-like protein (cupin superfamily)
MDLGWVATVGAPGSHPVQLTLMSEDATAPVNPSVTIEVADVDAVHAVARERGHEIVHPLTDEPWGVRRFFVRDPNGVAVNVMSHLPSTRREAHSAASAVTDATFVAAGGDRFGEHRGLGISRIDFKVVPKDSTGLLVLENTFHARGGPARHLHYDQDEWFYAVEGEFIVEVGAERFTLGPGDSLLAPRRIPHVWAYAGDALGRMLITFMPAGKMEAFFRRVTQANAMPPQDPEVWREHGMELVGPPLNVA